MLQSCISEVRTVAVRSVHGLSKIPFNRAGIHLLGFRHLSQVGAIYHKATVRLGRVYPICEYPQFTVLQLDSRI